MRLSMTDLDAMIDSLCFTTAGEWNEDEHGPVTLEQAEALLEKVKLERERRNNLRKRK